MVTRLCLVLACLPVAFLGGCSGGSQNPKCIPGASAACYCPTGQRGAQTCTSAGTFAACVCAASLADAGGTGDGADSSPPDAAGAALSDDAGVSPPDAVAAGGSGDSAGRGGEGGPVVDMAGDVSADVPTVPDAATPASDAPADAKLAADAPPDVSSADVLSDAAVDAVEGGETSGTTPAILSFTASPTTISAGKSSTLGWTVTGATMLTLDQGVGSVLVTVLGTTSQIVTPTQTTTYTLALNGAVSAQVTVAVVPPLCQHE